MSACGSGDLSALSRAHPFSFTVPQTRPSVRGRGGSVLVSSFCGTQGDRIFSYLKDFPGLTLALWRLLLVNQLLFKEAQIVRVTGEARPFLKLLSPWASIYSVRVIYFLSILSFRNGRKTSVIFVFFR